MNQFVSRYDEQFNSDVVLLPSMKIVSTRLYNTAPLLLYENSQTSPFNRQNDLVLTYSIEGQFTSHLGGLKTPFHNRAGTCSITYAPHDNIYPAPAAQWMESVVIGVHKSFIAMLQQQSPDRFFEKILTNIEAQTSFNLSNDNDRISPHVIKSLRALTNTGLSGGLQLLYQQSKVLELLYLQFEHARKENAVAEIKKISRQDIEKLHFLKEYLSENYLEDLTLDGLARLAGLNAYSLKTGFKRQYGQPVFEYIRKLRMQHAVMLLRDTQQSIAAIATAINYQHLQHFSTAFKKHFGQSPKYFRGQQGAM